MPDPDPIKFPPPKPRETVASLALPRRRTPGSRSGFEVLNASAAARETINAIVSATRTPFGTRSALAAEKLVDLERTLRQLERTLAERERIIAETQARLAERERDVAEAEALLKAREQLNLVTRKPAAAPAGVSPEEKAALEGVRVELERQEASLKEAKEIVREREQFLDESETKLFEKVQAQQEKESELEQREEDLRVRLRKVREREAEFDPQVAAALKAEDEAARKRDEFRE